MEGPWNGHRMKKLHSFCQVGSLLLYYYKINVSSIEIRVSVVVQKSEMCLCHGQVISKIYLSELNFYLSWTIGHRFWRTQTVC